MSNIEDFLETINYVPVDMRRNLGLLRELEYQEQKLNETLKEYQAQLMQIIKSSSTRENDLLKLELKDKVERTHLKSLSLRREKILIAMQTYKIVQVFNQGFDNEVQKFEEEFRNIPIQEFVPAVGLNVTTEELTQNTRNGGQGKRNREQIGSYQQLTPQFDSYQYPSYAKSQRTQGKSKKLPQQIVIPQEIPDEASYNNDPTPYCFCRQPSYGNMVACEENNCKFVWFHINCVGLDETLMNDVQQWFCPECQKNRQ